jgi:hypothetical protein
MSASAFLNLELSATVHVGSDPYFFLLENSTVQNSRSKPHEAMCSDTFVKKMADWTHASLEQPWMKASTSLLNAEAA